LSVNVFSLISLPANFLLLTLPNRSNGYPVKPLAAQVDLFWSPQTIESRNTVSILTFTYADDWSFCTLMKSFTLDFIMVLHQSSTIPLTATNL